MAIVYNNETLLPQVKVISVKKSIFNLFNDSQKPVKGAAGLSHLCVPNKNLVRLSHLALLETLAHNGHACRFIVQDAHNGSAFIPSGDVLFILPREKIIEFFQATSANPLITITASIGGMQRPLVLNAHYLKFKDAALFGRDPNVLFTAPLSSMSFIPQGTGAKYEAISFQGDSSSLDSSGSQLKYCRWHTDIRFNSELNGILGLLANYTDQAGNPMFFGAAGAALGAFSNRKFDSAEPTNKGFADALMPDKKGVIPIALASFALREDPSHSTVFRIVPLTEGTFNTIEYA